MDALLSKKWILEEVKGLAIPKSDITQLPFLQFDKSNVSGNTLCNLISGSYKLDTNGKIVIENLLTTERACAEDSHNDFDMKYLQRINSANSIAIKENKLYISTNEKVELIYKGVEKK